MIQIEVNTDSGWVTIYADAEGLDELAGAIESAKEGGKVFIGEPPGMLIIRPVGWNQENRRPFACRP